MFGQRLSLQLGIVMLVVALVPLVGAGWITLHLIEHSVSQQSEASRVQLAEAAGALVRNYIKDATTKLKSIARLIRQDEDPRTQTKRLNTLLDPPDIFLEVSYWTVGTKPEVQAQVQQLEYNTVLNSQNLGNRTSNSKVNQQVALWGPDSPILLSAANGTPFAADTVEKVGEFPALAISVPAPGGNVLTASLDFRPITQLLRNVAGSGQAIPGGDRPVFLLPRGLALRDRHGKVIASTMESEPPAVSSNDLWTGSSIGQGGWWIFVHEPRDQAMALVNSAVRQATIWFVLAVVLAIGLAFTFAGRIVLPLRSLARKAQALGQGNFRVRSEIDRADEIGQLAKAFDRMAAELQELDSMKSEFVAHVSHELRTPLTSAKMALANVQEGLGGPDSLPRVQQDLDRLIRMVNELLDVARIEAGLVLAKQSADLGEIVRTAAESLRPIAKVALEVRGTGDTLNLDPARVQQIVVNLVDNALKYARSRVDVEVRGREVRVTDDGPGVPPEHRERIFEKFSRVETGPKPPGAGLGLSIARKIARLHGGSLSCEGNTFVLRL